MTILLAIDGREHRVSAARLPLWMGRNEQLSVVLPGDEVSWYHAWIELVAGVWVVGDRSRNGTWLDGERLVGERPLREGARLRIGGSSVEVLELPDPLDVDRSTASIARREQGVLVLLAPQGERARGRLKTLAGAVDRPLPPRLARLLAALIEAGRADEGWAALSYEAELDLWPGQPSLYRGRNDLDRWWSALVAEAEAEGVVAAGSLPDALLATGFQSGARLTLPDRWGARAIGRPAPATPARP